MSRFARAARVMLPLVATLALQSTANAEAVAAPADSVTAVWRVQVVDLDFSSFDVAYSCSSLQMKIESMLKSVVDAEATRIAIRCSNLGMGTAASAKIQISSPIEATPENVRALTTFDTRTQLVAKMRSIQLPTEEDLPRFSASWRPVSMTRGKGLHISSGDCELVRSVRDQVLPHLAVKVTRSTGMCGSRSPVLEVMALVPDPQATLAKSGE